jgi:sortase B
MRKAVRTGALLLSGILLIVCVVALLSEKKEDAAADDQRKLKVHLAISEEPNDGADEDDSSSMDFSRLSAENDEIVAWLTVDGTVIDYPVTQAKDNRYYLTHTAERRYSKRGAVFLEFRNSPDFSDFNSILHAHNLKGGKMFGQLPRFKEKAFFDAHATGTLYTPHKVYPLTFFSCAVTPPASDCYRYAFSSPAERAGHLQMLREISLNWREIDFDPEADRLLTLSTCSYEYADARTVLIAKMSP